MVMLIGRAEYENVRAKQLFENTKASAMFPYVTQPGFDRCWLAAPRGSGKTLWIRKLGEEIPIEVNHLDKHALKYVGTRVQKPKAVVYDDLHYLLEVKRLGELNGHKTIDDKEVLEILEAGVKRAQEVDAKLLFVATEGPASFVPYFNEAENKSKFLRIVDGCALTTGDSEAYAKYLGDFQQPRGNAIKFRETLPARATLEMRDLFKAFDIPFTLRLDVREDSPRVIYDRSEHDALISPLLRNEGVQHLKDLQHAITDIANVRTEVASLSGEQVRLAQNLLRYQELFQIKDLTSLSDAKKIRLGVWGWTDSQLREVQKKFEAEKNDISSKLEKIPDKLKEKQALLESLRPLQEEPRKLVYQYIEDDSILSFGTDIFTNNFCIDRTGSISPIASIRELSALSDRLGGVNRETLKIDFGIPTQEFFQPKDNYSFYRSERDSVRVFTTDGKRHAPYGWVYSGDHVRKISQRIHKRFIDVSGRKEMGTLAQKLLFSPTDRDVEVAFLEHHLGQE